MKHSVSAILELAKQEVGYLEKASNSQLDDKTANAGSKNYTKYARDLYEAGYYNGNKNGYPWCDVFVDWLFFKAFGKEGQTIQCQTGDLGAGCTYSAGYYKSAGKLFKTPKIGDQIFFKDSSGDPCHTGIVVNVTDTRVYTIEGNTSSSEGVVANGGCVAEKSYALNYSRIYGYGRPKYDDEIVKPAPSTKNNTEKVSDTKMPTIKRGSEGKAVRIWQIIVGVTSDGIFGTNTYNATIAFQQKAFPNDKSEWDGIVGPKTWKAGLESV